MTSGSARAGLADVVEQGAEDAAAALVGVDVDALEPPDPAVPPVAPLAGDGRLADDPAVGARRPSSGAGRGRPGPRRRPGQHGRVEGLALGLGGEPGVEVGDRSRGRRGGRRGRSGGGAGSGRPSEAVARGGPGRVGWPPGGCGSPPRSGRRGPRGRSWPGSRRARASSCSSGPGRRGRGPRGREAVTDPARPSGGRSSISARGGSGGTIAEPGPAGRGSRRAGRDQRRSNCLYRKP